MNNQTHTKFVFHIHHVEELLHPGFKSIDSPVGLYFFEKGILVEINGSEKDIVEKDIVEKNRSKNRSKNSQHQGKIEYEYQLSKGKSSKYIWEFEKRTRKKKSEKEIQRTVQKEDKYEIIQKQFFASMDDLFRYQKSDIWNGIEKMVVFFDNHQEAFPFLHHILHWKEQNVISGSKSRISAFFVGDALYTTQKNSIQSDTVKDDLPIQQKFVLVVENPEVFLCLRLQNYFEKGLESGLSDSSKEDSLKGIYELYTSKHGSFYIPFRHHHSLLHHVRPTEDPSIETYNTHAFYPKTIHKSLYAALRLHEIDEFISYHLPTKISTNSNHSVDSNIIDLVADRGVFRDYPTEVDTKIPIEVRTRKTRHEQLVIGWFFEDIELNDLQKHLSYITEDEMASKRLQYIIAQEPTTNDSTKKEFISSIDIHTEAQEVNVEDRKRTHVLMFSLDGMGFRHPTFHQIGSPLQKPFENQNIFINIDEAFYPHITESTAQKLFSLYREEHFACVFLGERTFLFPKNMYPLNRITQHVLNHQKIRLDAFIDRCMWDLQSWVNLPLIPSDLHTSRRENVPTRKGTKEFGREMAKEITEDETIGIEEENKEKKEDDSPFVDTTRSSNQDIQDSHLDPPLTESSKSLESSNVDIAAKEDVLRNRISNILYNPTQEEEIESYTILYQYLQERMSYAPPDIWKTRFGMGLSKKNPFQVIQSDLILAGIICLYLGAPQSSRIIDDIKEIYFQLEHKSPIFLDVLTNKNVTTSELIHQQEFLSEFMSSKNDETSPIDGVLNFSDNIFVHILCWKLWLPHSKNIRLWNQVRPRILRQAKLILQNRVYPQQIHNLLSMRHVPVEFSEERSNLGKGNSVFLSSTPEVRSLEERNYISKRNIADFFASIEVGIQSLLPRIRIYGYLFFSIYAPDNKSHVHQQPFWKNAQSLIDHQPTIMQNFLHQAHVQSLDQLKDREPPHKINSPMLDALGFLQKLIEQSIEENFDFVLNEIFLKRASVLNQYQDILSNVSDEDEEIIYSRIRSYVEDNFLSQNQESTAEHFFILHREIISRSLRIETLNAHKFQSGLKHALFELIDIALEQPDIKKIRTSLWVMLTLLKGTSDANIDFACFQKFQQIQETLSKYVDHIPNPRQFGTMQRYQVAIIYLACIQFLPFEKRLDFICHCNALLNKEAKEIHMFRHFYLMSVALFSDQFLKNQIKEKFIVREYMRIVKHIQEIDICLS